MGISKFLVFPAVLLFLSSCSTPFTSQPKDFESFYKAHITSEMSLVREISKTVGYGVPIGAQGSIKLSGGISSVFSGSLNTNYSLNSQDRDVSLSLEKISALYTSILSSGSLAADEVSLISKTGDAFVKTANVTSENLLPPEMLTILKKYDGKWLSYTAEDRKKELSGATDEEVAQFQVGEMLSKMTLDDIQNYLTKYPIWKQTADLGMSGSLHSYSVALNTQNIIALVDDFTQKATGKALGDDAKTNLSNDLSGIHITGTMSFDPSESRTADFVGNIAASGSAEKMADFELHEKPNAFAMTTNSDGNTFLLNLVSDEKTTTLNSSLSQSGSDIGKLNVTIQKDGDRIPRIDSTLTAQGVTATFVETSDPSGAFSGSLNFGIGNLTWNGKIDDNILSSFHVKGESIGTNLTLDLEKSSQDDMLVGPLVVKSSNVESMRADVGLRVMPKRFSLQLNVQDVSSSGASLGNIDLDITKNKISTSTIEIPSSSTPMQSFIDEMNATLSQSSPFQEDTATGNDLSLPGNSVSGSIQ